MESVESGDSLDLLDLLTSQWVAIQTYSFDCGGGTVFYFFIEKMDQEMAVFLVQNGTSGTVLRFFVLSEDN